MQPDKNNAKSLVANRLNDFADALEEKSAHVQSLSEISHRSAVALTRFGDYLESRSTIDMVIDAAKLVRRYPLPLVFGIAGVALGMVINSRYETTTLVGNDEDDVNGADVLH